MKVKKLTLKSKEFPDKLRDIPSPPKQLWVMGDTDLFSGPPSVAIVGTRKVSHYGRSVTEKLASDLSRRGVTIISGMALGVDGIAHNAALEAGGKTIAILPSGLGRPYPATHASLAKQILSSGGLLASEYPPEEMPGRQHFIARNRLVSGLSDALLITEAALKSGTLHTARFALEQGKTVMAVPGNITSSLSEGTNNLIKSGAQIVTDTKDVLEVMGLNSGSYNQTVLGETGPETIILQLINGGVSEGAVLLAESGLTTKQFHQTLTMLELNARIKPLGADHWGIR